MSTTAADRDTEVHVPFATYPDGSPATLPVMTFDRVRSGAIVGTAASGKTTLLSRLADQLPDHGIQPWQVSALDADPAAVWHALSDEMHRRLREGIAGIEPDPVLVLADDADDVFRAWRRADSAVDRMLWHARKLNIGVLAATSEPALPGFAASSGIRDALLTHGDVLLMRHNGPDLNGLLPHYDGQPAVALPRGSGQGYTLTGHRPHDVWTVPGPR